MLNEGESIYGERGDVSFVQRGVDHTTVPPEFNQGALPSVERATRDIERVLRFFEGKYGDTTTLPFHGHNRLNEQDSALKAALAKRGWHDFPLADKLLIPEVLIISQESKKPRLNLMEQSYLEQIASIAINYGRCQRFKMQDSLGEDQQRYMDDPLKGDHFTVFECGALSLRFISRGEFRHTTNGLASPLYASVLIDK